jgi:hypothetical protein
MKQIGSSETDSNKCKNSVCHKGDISNQWRRDYTVTDDHPFAKQLNK